MKRQERLYVEGSDSPQRLFFSRPLVPDDWSENKSVWLGHPAIARLVARIGNRLQCWRYGHWILPEFSHCARCGKQSP